VAGVDQSPEGPVERLGRESVVVVGLEGGLDLLAGRALEGGEDDTDVPADAGAEPPGHVGWPTDRGKTVSEHLSGTARRY
jgi:hypothetical protein